MEDCLWTWRNLLMAGNGAAQTAKSETRKNNECSAEFSSKTAMLAQFPAGFLIARLCRILAADMNKQLQHTNCGDSSLCLFFKALSRREKAPGSLSIPANGHILSQAREFGSHRARNQWRRRGDSPWSYDKNIDYITPNPQETETRAAKRGILNLSMHPERAAGGWKEGKLVCDPPLSHFPPYLPVPGGGGGASASSS